MSIEQKIRTAIEKRGFLPMDEVIELSMSGEQNSYYRTYQPLGSDGDFITSPEVSQMFGEMVGIWCMDLWVQLGKPNKCNIIEFGAGLGTLMRDILRVSIKNKSFFDSINLWIVDINPILQEKQQKILKNFSVHKNWVSGLHEVTPEPSIVIANEFFDALPIKQYIKQKSDWKENVVVIDPETNQLTCDLKSIKKVLEQQLLYDHKNAGDGAVIEESPEGIKIIKSVAKHIQNYSGGALIIDYGYDIKPKSRNSKQYSQTLQAIKNHKYVPILSGLGTADLSSHVDFAALKKAATINKIFAYGAISQSEFLKRCGIDLRFKQLLKHNPEMSEILHKQYYRLVAKDQMGELFKAMAISSSDKIIPLGFQS